MEKLAHMADPFDLYDIYKKSIYGKRLVTQPRFATEDIKPIWMSTADWTILLGPDVNNLWHLPHSVHVTLMYQALNQNRSPEIPQEYSFIQRLYPDKYGVLQTVAVLHDIQEAKTGDINYHDKTPDSQQREKVAFLSMMQELYSDFFDLQAAQEIAKIVFHQDNPLGQEFQIIEEMGYLMTALQAVDAARGFLNRCIDHNAQPREREGLLRDGKSKLTHLVSDVINTIIPHLVYDSKNNIAAFHFLKNSVSDIDAAIGASQTHSQELLTAWNNFKHYQHNGFH